MAITNNDIQKALRIKRNVKSHFEKHSQMKVQAKELMPQFIADGIFEENHQDGLPIRDFLRHLDRENHLHLIPQAQYDQKDRNKNWFFINS
jgi:hypothetical protein